MKTFHPRTLLIIVILFGMLAGCGKTSAPEATATPQPTAPEATATPQSNATTIPPTPNPATEDALAEGWQAYQNGDLDTALEIGEQVRDQSRERGDEYGEAWALLGLVQHAKGKDDDALFMFEKAFKLGYHTAETKELMVSFVQAAIQDLIEENNSTYNAITIRSNVNKHRIYLERLKELDPQNPFLEKQSAWLNPKVFNLEDYTEEDLSTEEIINLLKMDRWGSNSGGTFSERNTYYVELYEKYPDNPIAMILLGAYEYYNDDYQRSLALLTASVEIEPGIELAWEIMGLAFEEIGAMEHAREAYIQCLRLNLDNAKAFNRLRELSDFLRWWPEDFFEKYGFGMYFNGTAQLSIVSETASDEAGVAQSEDDFIFFQLSWQTESGVDLTAEHLMWKMTSTIDASTPRFKSAFIHFDYGEVPMIYRNFSYKIIGSPDWADGVIAGWYSEGITYIMELRFVGDDYRYDHEYLNWLMAIYIETFTHQLESTQELQTNA